MAWSTKGAIIGDLHGTGGRRGCNGDGGARGRGGTQNQMASAASRVFLRRRRENFGILKRFQGNFMCLSCSQGH